MDRHHPKGDLKEFCMSGTLRRCCWTVANQRKIPFGEEFFQHGPAQTVLRSRIMFWRCKNFVKDYMLEKGCLWGYLERIAEMFFFFVEFKWLSTICLIHFKLFDGYTCPWVSLNFYRNLKCVSFPISINHKKIIYLIDQVLSAKL